MCFKERRALFGATALMLTGTILSIMSYHYFTGGFSEEGVARSRTWWEIFLNGQVLALAFMWFNFSDHFQTEEVKKIHLFRIRVTLAFLAVSVPAGILLSAAVLGWFEHKAPVSEVHNIFVVSIGFWLVAIIINLLATVYSRYGSLSPRSLIQSINPVSVWLSFPLIAVCGLIAFDYFFDTACWYYFVPVLCYTQAAIPFFERGLGIGRAAKKSCLNPRTRQPSL